MYIPSNGTTLMWLQNRPGHVRRRRWTLRLLRRAEDQVSPDPHQPHAVARLRLHGHAGVHKVGC